MYRCIGLYTVILFCHALAKLLPNKTGYWFTFPNSHAAVCCGHIWEVMVLIGQQDTGCYKPYRHGPNCEVDYMKFAIFVYRWLVLYIYNNLIKSLWQELCMRRQKSWSENYWKLSAYALYIQLEQMWSIAVTEHRQHWASVYKFEYHVVISL